MILSHLLIPLNDLQACAVYGQTTTKTKKSQFECTPPYMSMSPIAECDTIKVTEKEYQIVIPQLEYSKILKRHYCVANRTAEFNNACTKVYTVTFKHVFYFGSTLGDTFCFVCSGIAAELHFKFKKTILECTVDFHEEWRAHNTEDRSTPFTAEIGFSNHAVILTCSGVHHIQLERVGMIQNLIFKPADKPHATILHQTRQTKLLPITRPLLPANGQMWTLNIAPERVMLAPFCPLRGWVCITCKHAFDTPIQLARHCLRNDTLSSKAVVFNVVDDNGNIRMSSASMARYPVKRPPRMNRYDYVGFNYTALTHKLLALRQATQYGTAF